MQCSRTDREDLRQFNDSFSRKIREQRIPISGGIDLTTFCNLRCIHCYLPPAERLRKELDTTQVLRLIDEVTDAGCLYFLITGGEPLLRKDFGKIYRHARLKGLVVTVFTNATLVDDGIIGLFREFPPHLVDITLYGATEGTYEHIAGVRGSFRRCISGIEKLHAADIRIGLKSVIMKPNIAEYEAMEAVAGRYGARFRIDSSVLPRLDGDRKPLEYRVSPKEAAERDFLLPEKAALWKRHYEESPMSELADRLFNCGAGLTSFHIGSRGNLMPCVLGQPYSYNLLSGSFAEGWQVHMKQVREKKAAWPHCGHCERINLCGCCPGFFGLESGDAETVSEFLCELGSWRLHFIRQMQ